MALKLNNIKNMNKVRMTPQQIDLLQKGNVIETPEGVKYYNFPYWVRLIEADEQGHNAQLYMKKELPKPE